MENFIISLPTIDWVYFIILFEVNVSFSVSWNQGQQERYSSDTGADGARTGNKTELKFKRRNQLLLVEKKLIKSSNWKKCIGANGSAI